MAEDERLASSPSCENAGCSLGLEYICCASEDAVESEATYEATVSSTALDRLTLWRTGADDRCSSIGFAYPSAVRNAFKIETPGPEIWPVEGAIEHGCSQNANRSAIGGFGYINWRGDPCVLDFEFTLFFPEEPGLPSAIKFKARGLPLKEVGALRCQ